ncbi:hypothetical protein [Tepidimicrobium xylanilyticum]|mgnify:FL=1|uniref:Uncharacterized protein n=1 Tax=Tepidimicrobium xylanilyticum TaxID=1123352 RepID=A0A1H3DLD1_9FIRM|nr:hypothetical protein [Tepidimicrobium xylanilyticum]GMG97337.1 hypothetical protein EN5CB1_21630 [Tepidimicrobium xylanilyticum]SDX66464.1 hypothetical protein SAMN05660923_02699 [Tepidimicrobium xylanilyticum]
MKRGTIVVICMLLVMCFSIFSNVALASEIRDRKEEVIIEPNIMLPRDKTIYIIYASKEEAKDTYYYREYSENDEGWWSGTLYLTNLEKISGGRWRATYKGKIYFSY